jgi:hypothetical protein
LVLTQVLSENVFLHILFSSLSGLLLCVAGGVVLSREKNARLNKMFLGFFAGIGLHQLMDGLMTYFLFGQEDLSLSNLFRDLSIIALIVGLCFGSLVALNLYYKESLLSSTNLIIWGSLTLLLIIFGLIGDSVIPGGYYDQPSKNRELLGWIGITGSILVFSAIIVLFLFLLIRDLVDSTIRQKVSGILLGFVLINVVVFFFDISFVFPLFREIIGQPVLHFLTHSIALLGGLLTVGILWSPLSS